MDVLSHNYGSAVFSKCDYSFLCIFTSVVFICQGSSQFVQFDFTPSAPSSFTLFNAKQKTIMQALVTNILN